MVCLHTHCKCFEETAQITILFEIYDLISYSTKIKFRILLFKRSYSKLTATEKNCLR